jgi:hypothetical protein
VTGATGNRVLRRGESVYATAEEGELGFSGTGTVFVATTNEGEK